MKNRFGIDWSKIPGTNFWKQPLLNRRVFFQHTGSAVGGYFLMPSRPMETVARAASSPMGTAKNCIFVLLAGGPSHTDTFDLKEGAWLDTVTNGVKASELLKPTSYNDVRFPQGLMPKLAGHMESAVMIRSLKSWAAVHDLARTWLQIGRNPVSGLSKIAPHIGSVISLELGNTKTAVLPAFVSLNVGGGPAQGYLTPEHAPFYVSPNGAGLPNASHRDGQPAFDRRYALLSDLDAEDRHTEQAAYQEIAEFNVSARKLMYNNDVNNVFAFDADTRNRYGNTGFGNACVTARNLIRSKLGTRFVQITLGGWDNHQNIYAPNAGLAPVTKQLDNGLGSLMTDLKADGTFDETLIVVLGEFGRTVGNPNSQGGRDHFLQSCAMVAGAKVKGGRAIGKTDAEGRNIVDPGWSRDREIRAEDLEATIYSAMGIDWTTVRRDDPLGRGFEYVPFSNQDLYGPINELWG